MKKNISSLLLIIFSAVQMTATGQNASFVNPFIGTDRSHAPTLWGNYGGTYPGAVAPWGRVQLTPETSIRPSERGYYYTDDKIRTFSCAGHRSGYPNGSTGGIHLAFFPNRIDWLPASYDGRPFTHQQEEAKPGYYKVGFPEGDKVEATALPRTGLFRYHSSQPHTTLMICNAGRLIIRDNNTVEATALHTLIRFNQGWESSTLHNDTVYLHFSSKQTAGGLLVKLGTSTHSTEGSALNIEAEMPGWDFDSVSHTAYRLWDDELACVQIDTDDADNREKFYTALYHSFLIPWIISDADGRYNGTGQVTTGNAYGEFSTWDTFRSLHPLLSLLKPERQKDILRSAMDEYRTGGRLPKGPMTGMHMIPVIVDAYVKEAVDEDPAELLRAMQSCHNEKDVQATLNEYIQNGYLDASREKSVSITSEYAYDDWALGHFARLTGRRAEADSLLRRSLNYRNLFDAQTLFLLPRDANGFIRNSGELGYQESNRWTASFFAPHNIQDLINLAGGDENFVNHLLSGYNQSKIMHDNEPVFHYPYLFTWAGRPDITARTVKQILTKDYSTRPGGIPGNDDLGSTSSWFVLSAIGMFPACPGTGEYVLTPPLFRRTELRLSNGNTLTIETEGKTEQSATAYPLVRFDGKACNRMCLTHTDVSKGGKLVFDYREPVTDFSSYTRPFSETKEQPAFKLTAASPLLGRMQPDQPNAIAFGITNTGAKGTFIANLYDDTTLIATRKVTADRGQSLTDTLPFTLYKTGRHKLTIGNYRHTVNVEERGRQVQPLICTRITAPSLIPAGDTVYWLVAFKNRSGKLRKEQVPVFVNGKQITAPQVILAPGEEKTISLPYAASREGFLNIDILNSRKRVKVYAQSTGTCVLHLDYSKNDGQQVYDQSGFDNHGTLHGNLKWTQQGGQGSLQTGEQAYIVLPLSESLQLAGHNRLTMATWVCPQTPPRRDADFFTKGDYTLFKMEGPHHVAFFAGGWGRGECQVNVPEDWYSRWHHIAGVCTGTAIKLYIDGKLMQEIPVEGELEQTELPWNLGRNAEMPYSRFADMKFGSTRIYGEALSDDEVEALYRSEKVDFVE